MKLEEIMYADWYQSLFELSVQLYGVEVYAYYFDLPFEETLKRHGTRAKIYNDVLNRQVTIKGEIEL